MLSYHRVGEASTSDLHRGLFSATPEELDHQLRFIKRHFELIEPGEFDRALLEKRGRHVLLTFDDGYRDLYELAHPVLQANAAHAVMFLCTGFLDGTSHSWWDEIAWMIRHAKVPELPPGPWSKTAVALRGPMTEQAIDRATTTYWRLAPGDTATFLERLGTATGAGRRLAGSDWISWEQAHALAAAGHEIGAHTVTHPVLSTLPRSGQHREIESSLQRLQTRLGVRPRLFAYPVGTRRAFDATTMEVASECGLEFAFSNYGGWTRREAIVPLDMPRILSESLRSAAAFSATLSLPQVLARAAG